MLIASISNLDFQLQFHIVAQFSILKLAILTLEKYFITINISDINSQILDGDSQGIPSSKVEKDWINMVTLLVWGYSCSLGFVKLFSVTKSSVVKIVFGMNKSAPSIKFTNISFLIDKMEVVRQHMLKHKYHWSLF